MNGSAAVDGLGRSHSYVSGGRLSSIGTLAVLSSGRAHADVHGSSTHPFMNTEIGYVNAASRPDGPVHCVHAGERG